MDDNKKRIKPYGDTLNDGKVQMSFTLPLQAGPEASEAGKMLAEQMGLEEVDVVDIKDLGEGFCYLILYGKVKYSVDRSQVRITRVEMETMSYYEVNDFIRNKIGRKVVVVGACTGSDAHTVGLDAIMNMKGYAGEYGLERYPEIETYNLGSQVPNEVLIKKAIKVDADAILVSQVVTQKGAHVTNLTELVEMIEAEGLRERFILVVGGPRISHELALEIGFDAGFGRGTIPPEVASYIVQKINEREGDSNGSYDQIEDGSK